MRPLLKFFLFGLTFMTLTNFEAGAQTPASGVSLAMAGRMIRIDTIPAIMAALTPTTAAPTTASGGARTRGTGVRGVGGLPRARVPSHWKPSLYRDAPSNGTCPEADHTGDAPRPGLVE